MKKIFITLGTLVFLSSWAQAGVCEHIKSDEQAAECIEARFDNKVAKLQRKIAHLKAELKKELNEGQSSDSEKIEQLELALKGALSEVKESLQEAKNEMDQLENKIENSLDQVGNQIEHKLELEKIKRIMDRIESKLEYKKDHVESFLKRLLAKIKS